MVSNFGSVASSINTLQRHVNNTIFKKLSADPGPLVSLYTYHPKMSYYTDNTRTVRNPSCWMADIDMSFYSVSRDNWGVAPNNNNGSRAMLIAPDICIVSAHYQKLTPEGAFPITFTWRNSNGVAHTGTVASSASCMGYGSQIEGTYGYGPDIYVMKLTTSVDPSIKPVKFLPFNNKKYFPNNIYNNTIYYNNVFERKNLQIIAGTQDYKFVPVNFLKYIDSTTLTTSNGSNVFKWPNFPYTIYDGSMSWSRRRDNWKAFGYDGDSTGMVGGDSSSPFGYIINNEFVLFGLAVFPTKTTILHFYIPIINSMMSILGSSYQVSVPDLSSFRPVGFKTPITQNDVCTNCDQFTSYFGEY